MRRNKTGQFVKGQMNGVADGLPVTSGVSVTVELDGGGESPGGGTLVHVAGGRWRYGPTQAETNCEHLAVGFAGTGAIGQVQNVYPDIVEQRVDVPVSTRSDFDAAVDTVENVTSVAAAALVDTFGPEAIQQVADAMRLLPTGTVVVDSVDDRLTKIQQAIDDLITNEAVANAGTLTTGTETGTFADTQAQDGVYWTITSVATGFDAELNFNLDNSGTIGNPSSLRVVGRFQLSGGNSSRQVQVQVFNVPAGVWENRGAPIRKKASDQEYIVGLGRNYVATNGDVKIKFLYSSVVSNNVQAGDQWRMDVAQVQYTQESVTRGEILQAVFDSNPNRNYPNSAIVIDTENGQPGQDYGENGTPGNPSSNLVDATALAEIAGFKRFIVRSNNSILLTEDLPDWEWILSPGSSIDFGGKDVDNSSFLGGRLKGIATVASTGIRAFQSALEGLTAWGTFESCQLPIATSLTANGASISLLDCESTRPGSANPGVSGGAVSGLSLSIIKYGGGIDVSGLVSANVTISGRGSFSLTDADLTGSTVIASGNMRQVGATPAGATLIDAAKIDLGQVANAGRVTPTGTVAAGSNDERLQDIQSRVPAALTAGGNIKSDWSGILGTPITEPSAGRAAGNQSVFWGNNDAQTTKVVDNVGSGGGGGSGAGAFAVTVTVTDGTNPLQNVSVRLTADAVNDYSALTNASGVATFALDAATYNLTMTLSGYQADVIPDSVVVSGATNFDKTMSPLTITPSDPGKVTGYTTVYDRTGNVAPNQTIRLKAIEALENGTGVAFDGGWRSELSAANGLVQFPNMLKGYRYELTGTGDSTRVSFDLDANASDPTELPSIIILE